MGRWQPDARERLQAAALTLYAARGYEATTVAEIAEHAGLTKRTFFRYFTDKREVLFWGSELLEQLMVGAIEAAPDPATGPASAVELIGAALDAAGGRFEEVREFAGIRQRIVASSPELRERELIKGASLAAGMATALRARGLDPTAATLAAQLGTTVMHVTFERWVGDPAGPSFQQVAREVLGQLRTLVV